MVRTFFVFSYLFLFLIFHLFHLFIYIPLLSKKDRQRFVHKKARHLSRAGMKILGVTYEVEGLERIPTHTPILFTPNHQGYFDIPLLFAAIPSLKAFVAKVEMKKYPIVSLWMKHLGCVFLNRINRKSAIESVDESVKRIKNGTSMVIFPEGTTSQGRKMKYFKAGSFKIAQLSQVPIVPVVIDGTYQVIRKGSFVLSPCHLKVVVLDPIPPKEHIQMDTIDVADMVEWRIRDTLKEWIENEEIELKKI